MKSKKILSILVVLAMVISLVPMTAFAASLPSSYIYKVIVRDGWGMVPTGTEYDDFYSGEGRISELYDIKLYNENGEEISAILNDAETAAEGYNCSITVTVSDGSGYAHAGKPITIELYEYDIKLCRSSNILPPPTRDFGGMTVPIGVYSANRGDSVGDFDLMNRWAFNFDGLSLDNDDDNDGFDNFQEYLRGTAPNASWVEEGLTDTTNFHITDTNDGYYKVQFDYNFRHVYSVRVIEGEDDDVFCKNGEDLEMFESKYGQSLGKFCYNNNESGTKTVYVKKPDTTSAYSIGLAIDGHLLDFEKVAGTAPTHTHTAGTTYMHNDNAHWLTCSAEDCPLKGADDAATLANYETAFADATTGTALKTTLGYEGHSYTKGICKCGKLDPVNNFINLSLVGKTFTVNPLGIKLDSAIVDTANDITVKSFIFKVTPVATIAVTGSDGEAELSTAITNDEIKGPVTFLLPVDKAVSVETASVYHDGKFIGIYEIKTDEDGEKNIEIITKSFGKFSYVIIDDTNVAAKIGDVFYISFSDAIEDVKDEQTITLLNNASGNINISRAVKFTVDANGYTNDATISAGSGYAISNSNDIYTVRLLRSSGGGGGGVSSYTVKFETNGGNTLKNVSVRAGQTIGTIELPTKEGYIFTGWYTDKALTTKYDFASKVTKSMTLYAGWEEKSADNSKDQIILTIGQNSASVFGKTKTNDVAPKIVNDRTMLPIRFVAEALGATVDWDGEKQLVTISAENLKIEITIGESLAFVNGNEVTLDSPAFVENDRTYLPLRFVAENLGAEVEWVEEAQQVVITKAIPEKNTTK